MNKKILVVILVVFMAVLTGCSQDVQTDEAVNEDANAEMEDSTQIAEYRKISPEEAKELMVEGNIILDVRTQSEYDEGHIEGAILLPVDSILDGELDRLPDKNQVILVYCRSGNRSNAASKALVDEGYTAVYDFGGISDWPYEVVQ